MSRRETYDRLKDELENLNAECVRLREEISERYAPLSMLGEVAKTTGEFALKSPPLRSSLTNWFRSWVDDQPGLPVTETAKVIHAIAANFVSRKLLAWCLGIVTGLPAVFSILLVWQQNGFLARQNELLFDSERERNIVELQEVMREQVRSDNGAQYRFGTRARQAAFLNYLNFLGKGDDPNLTMSSQTLSGLPFPNMRWYHTDFNGMILTQSDFSNGYFEDCDLSDCMLFLADQSGTTFVECDLNDATIGAFDNCNVTGTDFSEAIFSFVSLAGSRFDDCQFRQAKFTYWVQNQLPASVEQSATSMDGTAFTNCDFAGTLFDQSTPLGKATFKNCTYTKDTQFPPNFDPEAVEGLALK